MTACLSCAQLATCVEATAQMILKDIGCIRYSPILLPEEVARVNILADFGPWSLLATPNPRRPIGEKHMSLPSRPQLRKLAQKLGLLATGPAAFSTKAEELVEMLKPHYAEIAEMTDEDIDAALSELNDAAPAAEAKPAAKVALKPAPASAKPAPKAAPAGTKKPAPAGTKKPAPAGAKPAPAGAKPGPAPAKIEQSGCAAVSVDLGPVIERVDAIGKMVDKQVTLTDSNKAAIADLNAKLDVIISFATWQYNQNPDHETITSISDVDWS